MSTTKVPPLSDDESLRRHSEAAKRLKALQDTRIRAETTVERSEASVLEDIAASRSMGISEEDPEEVLNALRAFILSNRQHNSEVIPEFEAKLTEKERGLAAAETQQAA